MSLPEVSSEFEQLAYEKLATVLGPYKARVLLEQICAELSLELHSAQDLFDFSQSLAKRRGFEGAVGAMLGVTAILRGARADRDGMSQRSA